MWYFSLFIFLHLGLFHCILQLNFLWKLMPSSSSTILLLFQLIATGTSSNNSVYFVDNFEALDGIAGELREVISSFALEGKFEHFFGSCVRFGFGHFGLRRLCSVDWATTGNRKFNARIRKFIVVSFRIHLTLYFTFGATGYTLHSLTELAVQSHKRLQTEPKMV